MSRLIHDSRISVCNRSSLFRVSTLHHVEVVACRALALDLSADCIYQSCDIFFIFFSPFFETERRLFLVLPWVLLRRVEHALIHKVDFANQQPPLLNGSHISTELPIRRNHAVVSSLRLGPYPCSLTSCSGRLFKG